MQAAILTQESRVRFNDQMARTYKKVFSLAYRLAGNRSDAEDHSIRRIDEFSNLSRLGFLEPELFKLC